MTHLSLDTLSFRSLYIEAKSGDLTLARASAFPWKCDDQVLLFTNWHVLAGVHPQTQQPLDPQGSTPDSVTDWLHRTANLASWSPCEVPLFDSQGRPRWLEHPNHRSAVDVAAIPVSIPESMSIFPLNDLEYDEFRVEISHDVFVIGFPRGLSASGRFPIWKRGTIASEPQIDLHGLPSLLIDSATREGMSGSPVFVQFNGLYMHEPGKLSGQNTLGILRRFLGVYSGRLPGVDEFEAQLGFVWKQSVVDEISAGGVRPD